MVGGAALEPSSLTLAHPDALVTSVASFEPEQLLDLLLVQRLPGRQHGGGPGGGHARLWRPRYGFRLDRDLIEPLGGSISYSLPKLRSLLSAPNLMAVASLDDREAFARGMDGLMAMMKEDESPGRAKRTEYRGATVYTLVPRRAHWLVGRAGCSPWALPGGPLQHQPADRDGDGGPGCCSRRSPSHAKREVRRVAKLAEGGSRGQRCTRG